MKPQKLILFLLLLQTCMVYAHQDFWTYKTFGNVKVRIKTGFDYEEIHKVWIIGELTRELSHRLLYKDTIFLDFEHHYTNTEGSLPDYFISYGDGAIKNTWEGGGTNYFLKKKALVVREVSRKFDVAVSLKLVEYAIGNLAAIKKNQKPLVYNKNYCQWLISTIDTAQTRQLSLGLLSSTVKEVLRRKVYRNKKNIDNSYDISYFFQNNQYHIYFNSYDVRDSVLLVTDNVYQLRNFNLDKAVMFNTDSTFYYVQGTNNPHVSRQMMINGKGDYYCPYAIDEVGANKVTISFWNYRRGIVGKSDERTLLYRIDKDELVQDLDKALDSGFNRF